MKKLQSKVFQVLVAVMLACGSFAFTACDDDNDGPDVISVNGINYILGENNTCTVTKGNYIGAVAIPGGIEYGERRYQVTRIGANAFLACTELTAVDIPNTVNYIDIHAFDGCANLTSVEFPANLEFIGNYAFRGTGLTEVVLPDALTGIGAFSFANNHIGEVTLGKATNRVGWCAFKNCAINTITVRGVVPPTMEYYPETDEWPINHDIMASATLRIPGLKSYIEAYQEATPWNVFFANNHVEYYDL